jgi:hypothetical protein
MRRGSFFSQNVQGGAIHVKVLMVQAQNRTTVVEQSNYSVMGAFEIRK